MNMKMIITEVKVEGTFPHKRQLLIFKTNITLSK